RSVSIAGRPPQTLERLRKVDNAPAISDHRQCGNRDIDLVWCDLVEQRLYRRFFSEAVLQMRVSGHAFPWLDADAAPMTIRLVHSKRRGFLDPDNNSACDELTCELIVRGGDAT